MPLRQLKEFTDTAFLEVGVLVVYSENLYASVYFSGSAKTEIWKYDGSTWTLAYTPAGDVNNQYAIVFLNKLVIGQNAGKIITFDGTTWSVVQTPLVSATQAFSIYGGLLYAVDRGGKVVRTANLADWTTVTAALDDGYIGYGSAVLGSNLYIGTGKSGTLDDGHLYKYDGATWTEIEYPESGYALALGGLITFNNKIYVSIRILNNPCKIYTYDGTNWTLFKDLTSTSLHTGPMLVGEDNYLNATLQGGAVEGANGGLLLTDGTNIFVESYASKSMMSIAEYNNEIYLGTRRESGDVAHIFKIVAATGGGINMNCYADLTTLKSASVGDFPSVTTHDTFLMTLIEAASRAIDSYCNRYFFTETRTYYFDGVAKTLMLHKDLLTVTTLKKDDDGDATFEDTLATTDYILYPLNGAIKNWINLAYQGDYSDFAAGIPRAVEITGVWGYGDGESTTPYYDSSAVVSDAGMTANATTHALATGKGASFAVGQTILVNSEQMYISGISTDTLTLTRGVNGTTAAVHVAATPIYIYKYPKAITVATIMQVLRWWKRRESAFQTSVTTEIGSVNVYRGLDPDIKLICNQFRVIPV